MDVRWEEAASTIMATDKVGYGVGLVGWDIQLKPVTMGKLGGLFKK